MSSGENEYSTLAEYLESLRSPTLPRSTLNFESSDTPPPLVDAPSDYESSESESEPQNCRSTTRQKSRAQPQSPTSDIQLLKGLGLSYSSESTALACPPLAGDCSVDSCEAQTRATTHEQPPMITVKNLEDVSNTSNTHIIPQTLTIPKSASERLIDAIAFHPSSVGQSQTFHPYKKDESHISFSKHDYHNKRQVRVSISSLTTDDATETFEVSSLSLKGSPPDKHLDIRPPPRPMLPSLQVDSGHSPRSFAAQDLNSAIQSPTLAKFVITPTDGHPSQTLPRIQDISSPPSTTIASPGFRQTLPSLTTALGSINDFSSTPYADSSSGLSKLSPSIHSHFGPSPSAYSHSSPTVTMSPPRLRSNPASWRTLSHNSSNSSSEYISAHGSNNASTPASSVPGQSPGNSMHTSQYAGSDHDSGADSDHAASGVDGIDQTDANGGIISGNSSQGYPCTWPGCTAVPFQTQYLLNSHTNVHSNQRPHFCPVKDCPRGPGGQGFKRKNEMIRHGLVHQSPGYVCPFCTDQQHKYPRPDNLQRHVRVHHVEKDRDDPMLREVLAQRPEGGNRGRRRRLGG